MVVSFAESEANQLEGMINFIKSAKLDDELRAKNWAGFARGYNGSGYRANQYDTRLAKAYAFWQKKPDTKWTPTSAAGEEMEAEAIQVETKQQSIVPIVAVGSAGVATVSASPFPLGVQFMLGFVFLAVAGYAIYLRLEDEE
jgi:hypothetical protein